MRNCYTSCDSTWFGSKSKSVKWIRKNDVELTSFKFNPFCISNSLQFDQTSTKNNANNLPGLYTHHSSCWHSRCWYRQLYWSCRCVGWHCISCSTTLLSINLRHPSQCPLPIRQWGHSGSASWIYLYNNPPSFTLMKLLNFLVFLLSVVTRGRLVKAVSQSWASKHVHNSDTLFIVIFNGASPVQFYLSISMLSSNRFFGQEQPKTNLMFLLFLVDEPENGSDINDSKLPETTCRLLSKVSVRWHYPLWSKSQYPWITNSF
jgi:hypothetical protein